jgi:Ca2+-binding EF-hand superfamily protein
MLPVEEMRHVLTRIGDPLNQEEVNNFLNILDVHGDGFVRLDEVAKLFIP